MGLVYERKIRRVLLKFYIKSISGSKFNLYGDSGTTKSDELLIVEAFSKRLKVIVISN